VSEQNERVAKLETRMDAMERRMDKSETDRQGIHTLLTEVNENLIKQRTFIGGILFTVGAVWSVLQVGWDMLRERILR